MIVVSSSAWAAELPSGRYDCAVSSTMHLGTIEIDGNVYRMSGDDTAYSYGLTSNGDVNWSGALGALSSNGNTVISTKVRNAGGGKVRFDIVVATERGTTMTVRCSPE